MHPRRSLAALAVTGVVAAGALVGCSLAEGSPASSDASPAAATSDTVDVDTFAAQLRDGVAAIDTAQLTVAASGGMFSGEASGPLDLTGSSPELSLKTDGSGMTAVLGGPAELLVADGKGYVKAPTFTGGKYADLQDLAKQAGPMLESFGGEQGPGQGWSPKLLGKGGLPSTADLPDAVEKGAQQATSVTDEGSDSVGGTDVEHYVMTFEAPDSSGSSDDASHTVDVWLDDDGVPVKTSSETKMGTITATLTDLGQPVSITAPPASQVTTLDLDSLLKGFSAFGGGSTAG